MRAEQGQITSYRILAFDMGYQKTEKSDTGEYLPDLKSRVSLKLVKVFRRLSFTKHTDRQTYRYPDAYIDPHV